jgi:dihydrofolate synthase/folylpolyglutamate synthase
LTEPEEAYRVILEKAGEVSAPIFEVSPDMWKVNRADDKGIDFSFNSRYDKNLRITIRGGALYQCENASLAATACGIILRKEGKYDPELIERGIEKCFWPGRMEEILPDVWIDGAHNPDGMRAFLESIRNASERGVKGEQPVRRILLFSCMKDKDYRQELRMIGRSGLFAEIAAVPMSGSRALGAEDLRHLIGECADGVTVHS